MFDRLPQQFICNVLDLGQVPGSGTDGSGSIFVGQVHIRSGTAHVDRTQIRSSTTDSWVRYISGQVQLKRTGPMSGTAHVDWTQVMYGSCGPDLGTVEYGYGWVRIRLMCIRLRYNTTKLYCT